MSDNNNQLLNSQNQVIKWEPINFVFYFSFVKWPVLLTAIIELLVRFLLIMIFDDILIRSRFELAFWIIRIISFVYLGYKIFKNYGEALMMGCFAGAVSGLILGLIVSFFRFIEGFKVWKIFNLITETITVAIVGCLVVFLVVYLWDLFPKLKK